MDYEAEILSLRGGFLQYNKTDDRFRYLGYSLDLTKTERKLLARLMESDDYCSVEVLCRGILDESADPEGLVRAHVSHINKKAFAIGERQLIECRKNIGYKIAFSL